jgi:hypothetical protein
MNYQYYDLFSFRLLVRFAVFYGRISCTTTVEKKFRYFSVLMPRAGLGFGALGKRSRKFFEELKLSCVGCAPLAVEGNVVL